MDDFGAERLDEALDERLRVLGRRGVGEARTLALSRVGEQRELAHDEGLATQAGFNIDALETMIGRKVADREALLVQQHQAARWTYIGSGMVHERFQDTLNGMSRRAAERIAEVASLFA